MKFVIVLTLLVLAFACGSDSSSSKDNGSLLLTPSPGSVSFAPGSSTTVSVQLTRQGSLTSANIAFTANGLPSGMTATFSPASTTGGMTTLTLTASAAVAPGTSLVQIVGTALDHPSLDPALTRVNATIAGANTITVSGIVYDTFVRAIANAQVQVWSAGATVPSNTTTDATGHFTMAGVLAPYDVRLMPPAGASAAADALFLGLTSPSPRLAHPLHGQVGPSGEVTGAHNNLSGTNPQLVVDVQTTSGGGGTDQTLHDGSNYDIPVWPAVSGSATVRALQWDVEQANGLPIAYLGSTRVQTSITAGTPDNLDLALAGPIASRTSNLIAPGTTFVQLLWIPRPTAFQVLFSTTTLPGSVTLPDTSFEMGGFFTNQEVVTVFKKLGAGDTSVSFPAAATIVGPDDNAVGTALTVGNADGATTQFIVIDSPVAAHTVVTTASSLPLSVFAAHGVTLQCSNGCVWEAVVTTGGDPQDAFAPSRTSTMAAVDFDGTARTTLHARTVKL